MRRKPSGVGRRRRTRTCGVMLAHHRNVGIWECKTSFPAFFALCADRTHSCGGIASTQSAGDLLSCSVGRMRNSSPTYCLRRLRMGELLARYVDKNAQASIADLSAASAVRKSGGPQVPAPVPRMRETKMTRRAEYCAQNRHCIAVHCHGRAAPKRHGITLFSLHVLSEYSTIIGVPVTVRRTVLFGNALYVRSDCVPSGAAAHHSNRPLRPPLLGRTDNQLCIPT